MMIRTKKRNIYAVTTGGYAGEMWLYCGKSSDEYHFLAVPVMENRYIKKELFDNGIKGGVLKFVEKIPRYVYETAVIQFKQNEKTSIN